MDWDIDREKVKVIYAIENLQLRVYNLVDIVDDFGIYVSAGFQTKSFEPYILSSLSETEPDDNTIYEGWLSLNKMVILSNIKYRLNQKLLKVREKIKEELENG